MSARIRPTVVAALATTWVAVLAGGFLLHRGDDVGRLPSLIAASATALARGPVWGLAGLLPSVAGSIVAVLIGTSWYGLGRTMLSRVEPASSSGSRERAVTVLTERMLLGAATWSL
ncbi:MAG TPA: hypothetical protein VF653_13515, partial [Methylomirabilota bacterium]